MKKIIQRAETFLLAQLKLLHDNIATYKTDLTLTDEEILAAKAMYLSLKYVLDFESMVQNFQSSFTAYKNWVKEGPSSQVSSSMPAAIVYPTPVPVIITGNIISQYARFSDDIIKNPGFSDKMGIALGFYPVTEESALAAEIKPPISVKNSPAGHPILHSLKGNFQGYQVYKDWGDGKGFVAFDKNLAADFVDNSDLPAQGIAKVWRYKIIYLLKNEEVGNFSDIVSVTVMWME